MAVSQIPPPPNTSLDPENNILSPELQAVENIVSTTLTIESAEISTLESQEQAANKAEEKRHDLDEVIRLEGPEASKSAGPSPVILASMMLSAQRAQDDFTGEKWGGDLTPGSGVLVGSARNRMNFYSEPSLGNYDHSDNDLRPDQGSDTSAEHHSPDHHAHPPEEEVEADKVASPLVNAAFLLNGLNETRRKWEQDSLGEKALDLSNNVIGSVTVGADTIKTFAPESKIAPVMGAVSNVGASIIGGYTAVSDGSEAINDVREATENFRVGDYLKGSSSVLNGVVHTAVASGGALETGSGIVGTANYFGGGAAFGGTEGAAELSGILGTAAGTIVMPVAITEVVGRTLLAPRAENYAADTENMAETVTSMDNERILADRSSISKNNRDIGLPTLPTLNEYTNLGLMNGKVDADGHRINLTSIAQDPERLKGLLESYARQSGPAGEARQNALDDMNGLFRATPLGRLYNAVTPGDWDKTSADQFRHANDQLDVATQALGALGEFNNYAQRMEAHHNVLKALNPKDPSKAGADYADQFSALDKLQEFYHSVSTLRTVSQMEGKDGLNINAFDHPNEFADQRRELERRGNEANASTRKAQEGFWKEPAASQAQAELRDAQAKLDTIPSSIQVTVHNSHGGGTLSEKIRNPEYVKAYHIMSSRMGAVNQIEGEIEQKVSEVSAQEQIKLSTYFATQLARQNVLDEFEKVAAMKDPNPYFQKNKDFIAKAGLQDRQDLAVVGLSTSMDDLIKKMHDFAPDELAAREKQRERTAPQPPPSPHTDVYQQFSKAVGATMIPQDTSPTAALATPLALNDKGLINGRA